MNRRFLAGYLHFKDEPKVKKLRDDVLKYNRMVRDLGLRDHQVGILRRLSVSFGSLPERYHGRKRLAGKHSACSFTAWAC